MALLDGSVEAVRAYLEHFWAHWSRPSFELPAADLDRLAAAYGRPGAFMAAIGWYRAGSGTVATSLAETRPARSDRIQPPHHGPLAGPGPALPGRLVKPPRRHLDSAGHFTPLEAPAEFADAIRAALSRPR